MKKHSIILFWGILISFLGSLPPGIINIAAMQINLEQGKQAAIIYATGSMLAEILVVRLALAGIKQLLKRRQLFYLLELCTAALLLFITIGCFIIATRMPSTTNQLVHAHLPPFRTGVLLSLFNPVHIPFWLGWTAFLLEKDLLRPEPGQYNWMTTGIAIGTMAGFIIFINAGGYILDLFSQHQFIIYLLLGSLLSVASILYFRKMILSPASKRYAKLISRVMR